MANIAKLLGQPPTEGPRCYPSRDAIVCTTLLAWPWSKTITTNSNSSAIKSENMPSASVMAPDEVEVLIEAAKTNRHLGRRIEVVAVRAGGR